MKKTHLFALALAAAAVLCTEARAAVTISDVTLTPTSVTFTINGTLPTLTGFNENLLYVTNTIDLSASPGFALGEFITSSSSSFSGTQTLNSMFTGSEALGDYFLVQFASDLVGSAAINGTFTANFSTTAFDPSQVSTLNFYWGRTDTAADSGTFLGTAAVVPEPSSVILLLGGVAIAGLRRRRR